MVDAVPLLSVSKLQKSYAAPVLVDFSLTVQRGEVHALVGANGAGKSTFARVLCGLTARDTGDIRIDGRPHRPTSAREAARAGVIMVPQELNVVATLTVAENVFVHDLPRRGGFVRFTALHDAARQALSRVGLDEVDPDLPAGRLGVGQQQLVGIAAALTQQCRLLILDEPTAALTDPEVERLFGNIRRLQREGVAIIYVSHRMDEISRIADRITVMRDGRNVATHLAGDTKPAQLVREMVGHGLPQRTSVAERPAGQVVLRVRRLRAGDRVRDVSFDARRGEILGLAGLVGAGRTETLRAIFGADTRDDGEILIDDERVVIRSPVDAVRAGMGLVPEDRARDGLLWSQSIRANTTLGTLWRHAGRGGWLDADAENRTTDTFGGRLRLRCASYDVPVGELSGGNQQKVLMARWLARDCRILLLDEPTRGIDVATRDIIYAVLRDLASGGKAVVVVSSDLVELLALCDRLLVLSQGRVTAEFTPADWTQEKVAQAAFSGYLARGASITP